ncbi:MAG: hypothetical protein ACI9QD_000993 [Thermoproteota archaeon]|jgi:hypothetical protein
MALESFAQLYCTFQALNIAKLEKLFEYNDKLTNFRSTQQLVALENPKHLSFSVIIQKEKESIVDSLAKINTKINYLIMSTL